MVVDTDVVSFLLRKDTRSQPYRDFLTGRIACVSMMTVAELRLGAELARWGASRVEAMEQSLRVYTVLPLDDAATREPPRHAAVACVW